MRSGSHTFRRDLPKKPSAPLNPASCSLQRFKDLKSRMQNEMDTLNELKRRGEAGQLLSINPDDIPPVFEEVLAVEQDFQAWQWKLDCCLPGELGKVGKWLSEAEKCLYQPWPTGSDKEVHEQLAERLQQHKVRALFVVRGLWANVVDSASFESSFHYPVFTAWSEAFVQLKFLDDGTSVGTSTLALKFWKFYFF